MTRKLKMLGMALVAVLALTAVVASAASATGSYTASSYPTNGTGESAVGNDTFITAAGKVECQSHYEGTLSAKSSSLTISAKYIEKTCKAFGFLSAQVNMNSCDYQFGTPTGSGDNWAAPVQVVCGATPINIIASTCEVKIGAQSPGGSVTITNNTAVGDVSVKAGVTGIEYEVTKSGIGCPFNSSGGVGKRTGGEYIQDKAITFDSTNGATIDVG